MLISKNLNRDGGLLKKNLSDHNCVNPTVNSNHKPATSTFFISKNMSFVKVDLNTTGTVHVLMEEQLFTKIGYMKAWSAPPSKAIERIYSD